jgi:hypothetical protein
MLRETFTILSAPLAVALLCIPASAQEQDEYVKVEMRVVAGRPGSATLDRGGEDGLRRGDRVTLRLKDGTAVLGTVSRVEERGSVADLDDQTFVAPSGTRAEALIPSSRLVHVQEPLPPPPAPTPPRTQGEAGETAPEHPRWPERNDGWSQGQPLLARVRPLRPIDRAPRTRGRLYSILDFGYSTEDERTDAFVRTGTELTVENRFGRGERVHFDGELNYRNTTVPDDDDESVAHLRIDRASYATGGTRFEGDRLEFGRFLQDNIPEFGIVDGAEWGRRLGGGDRIALSAGFMPKPEATPDTVDDFQASASYRWVYDESEQLSAAAGFQKTLHHGDADRDLLLAQFHYLPLGGWSFAATAWVDYYTSSDVNKGQGLEVTQAFVNAGKRWEGGNAVNLVYSHMAFPEIDRDEFLPVTAAQLADDHNERASLQTRLGLSRTVRTHALVGGWVDQDDAGRDVQGGFEFDETFFDRTVIDVTGFASDAKFVTLVGARASIQRRLDEGRLGVMYEISNARFDGFSNANDDLPQHRVRFSTEHFFASGWSFASHLDGLLWDNEHSLVLGFYLQKSF